ncbi:MAG: efflux family protein [Clostridiales bacterium]|nr:efflux family protein [Clostridiales bacterium]
MFSYIKQTHKLSNFYILGDIMLKLNFKAEVYKKILELAWPSVTEQLLIMMVGVVSTIFVGRIGTAELAAVGLINMIILFFQTIFAGLATGSTVVIARVTGEGDMQQAKEALIQSLILGILAGLVVTIPGYIFASQILNLFFAGAEAHVIDIGLQYYKIVLIGLPFLVVDLIVAGAVRGSGDTKTPMYVTTIVNIINIIMSSLLIFGISVNGQLIIPALGIAGAAISVNIARISGGIMRILSLYLKISRISLSLKDKYTFNKKMMGRIINIGLPAFIEQFIMQGGFLGVQIMVISMGTVESAAFQIGQNVNSFVLMPTLGFAIATTTIVGQNLGSKNYEDAAMYSFESMKLSICVIALMAALTAIFARPLIGMYTTDLHVVSMSLPVVRIFSLIDIFLGVMHINSATLRAAGDNKYVVVTALVGLWLLRILNAYLLHRFFGLGIYAVMIGISTDFCLRGLLYVFRVKAGKWKYLKV